MYIVVEGLDGCGKDTQVSLLFSHLFKMGETPLVVSEPTDSYEHGQLLRKMLQTGAFTEAHVAMFLADRLSLLTHKVKPALERGRPVISSRSFCSTLVYQQENWPMSWLYDLHRILPARPTHIFILDLPATVCIARVLRRAADQNVTPEHYEKLDILERVRQRYLALETDPRMKEMLAVGGMVHVVDATGTSGEIHQQIKELL